MDIFFGFGAVSFHFNRTESWTMPSRVAVYHKAGKLSGFYTEYRTGTRVTLIPAHGKKLTPETVRRAHASMIGNFFLFSAFSSPKGYVILNHEVLVSRSSPNRTIDR